MPLKCFGADHQPVYAFELTSDAFEALRASERKSHTLTFPCCDSKVGLRISSKGLQHFYHADKRLHCEHEAETEAHLQIKRLVMEAARSAGWNADCEVSAPPGGSSSWRADVLMSRGSVKIAIEVQLSNQPWGDIVARQARYRADGVRGLWLLGQPNYSVCKETPAFQLRETEDGVWQVRVSPPREDYNVSLTKHAGNWAPLTTFVSAALSKNLVWAPVLELNRANVLLRCAPHHRCECGEKLLLPTSLTVSLPYPGYRSLLWTILPLVTHKANPGPAWLNALVAIINKAYPDKSGALLAARHTRGRAYHFYRCPSCSAEIGDVTSRHSEVVLRRDDLPVKGLLPAPEAGSAEEGFLYQWWLRVPNGRSSSRGPDSVQLQLDL